MPIYAYHCPACGHDFDRLVRLEAPPPPCPQCAGLEVAQQVTAAAIRLKGGGWYETDFKGKDEGRKNLA